MDDGNGLHYMRARYYKEEIKRFMSLDALHGDIMSPQALNRYAYVLGNPIMGVDPSGLSIEFGSLKYKLANAIEQTVSTLKAAWGSDLILIVPGMNRVARSTVNYSLSVVVETPAKEIVKHAIDNPNSGPIKFAWDVTTAGLSPGMTLMIGTGKKVNALFLNYTNKFIGVITGEELSEEEVANMVAKMDEAIDVADIFISLVKMKTDTNDLRTVNQLIGDFKQSGKTFANKKRLFLRIAEKWKVLENTGTINGIINKSINQ